MLFSDFLLQADNTLHECHDKAQDLFEINFSFPEVTWDLRGVCAGKAWSSRNLIQLNRNLCENNMDSFMETVVHEYAHLVVHNLKIKNLVSSRDGVWSPHGKIWKQVMLSLGYSADRCHKYKGVKKARVVLEPYVYRCSCRTHTFTAKKHLQVKKGFRYKCLKCQDIVVFEKVSLAPVAR